ncbi:MAG TPA: BamA/TamA family outer membrane protein [Burkholderiales bacterium]|nr:BamA/TamA family outer membrane protein [Burkholderiales bacterium]
MKRWHLPLVLALSALSPLPAQGEDGGSPFRDKAGDLDLSEWLLDRKGFLPVPVLVTEPAVGYGGGMFALFFRQSLREAAMESLKSGRMDPPDIFAVGGLATQNGTWLGAGGGMVSFDEHRYRWRGGIARLNANLDFFGLGGNLPAALAYNADGWASIQQGMMRLGRSDAWLVARWNYFDLKNRFDLESDAGRAGSIVRNSRSSGLGVSLEFDSRDNIFTPSRGWKGSLDMTWYDPGWGSDTRFRTYRAYAFAYAPIGKSVVLAGRADTRGANGDVPFYLLPFVDLRGVPAMRLQDRRTAVIETEARWNVTPRWALVGFAGAARAWGTNTSFSEGTDSRAGGVGFRYLIAQRLGMYVGMDFAKSTQDRAFYITVGNAWR